MNEQLQEGLTKYTDGKIQCFLLNIGNGKAKSMNIVFLSIWAKHWSTNHRPNVTKFCVTQLGALKFLIKRY
jgi:hypothetical protein